MPSFKKRAENAYENYLRAIENKHGNAETDSQQLTKIGRSMFGNKYIGTFASDRIPKMGHNTYAIVNLDDSGSGGSHWVSIVKDRTRTYIYDSFGRKTYSILPELIQSASGPVLQTQNDKEQSRLEDNCGQRSLAALKVYDTHGWKGLKHI